MRVDKKFFQIDRENNASILSAPDLEPRFCLDPGGNKHIVDAPYILPKYNSLSVFSRQSQFGIKSPHIGVFSFRLPLGDGAWRTGLSLTLGCTSRWFSTPTDQDG